MSDETTRPQELAYGILREPATPSFLHQRVVGRVFRALDEHVRRRALGTVVVAPMDVILDEPRALVVQPDVMFVSNDRRAICTDRIWGAPDLVVEVLSNATRRHDQTRKVAWYERYGVRECWLVDPIACEVHVLGFAPAAARAFEDEALIRSAVLPRLRLRTTRLFSG